MTKNTFLLFTFLLLASQSIPAQSYIGFRIDPFFFVSKTYPNRYGGHSPKDESGVYLTSILLSYQYQLSNKISLNSRAGYLWTNDDRYNGFEMSQLVQLCLTEKNYLIVGTTVHFNREDFVREFHIEKVVIPFITFGLGMRFSKLFSNELQFNLPLVKEYKTSNSPSSSSSYRLWGIIKLSFGFEWEL